MSSVLTGQPEHPREPLRTDVLQPNQANTYDGVAVVKLRAKWQRKEALHHVWLGAEVHQQPSSYDTVHLGHLHAGLKACATGLREILPPL